MIARKSFGPDLVNFIKQQCIPLAVPGANSMTVQTAAGRVLGAPKPGYNSDVGQGHKEFLKLPVAERRPKDIPQQPDARPPVPTNGLVLRVYARAVVPGKKGTVQPDENVARNAFGPQGDFLWLTEEDKKSLAPAQPTMGFEYKLPEALFKRIACFYLVDRTLKGVLEQRWPTEHFRAGELSLRVIDVTDNDCAVKLFGAVHLGDDADLAKAQRLGQFHLYGRMVYNHKAGVIERLELAALGVHVHAQVEDYAARIGQQKSVGLGIVFELAAPGSLGYGSIPWGLYNGWRDGQPNPGVIDAYFGSNPYAKTP